MTSSPKHGRRLRAAIAGLALLAAVGVAGCSGGGAKTASSSAVGSGTGRSDAQAGSNGAAGKEAAPAAPDKSSLPDQAQAGAGTAAGANPAKVPVLPAIAERSIVHTGNITVRVHDVDQKAAQAEALAAGAGGYVGGDDRQIDAGQSTATLTLRVPAGRFDATLNAIALLGTPLSRNVSTQDVTSQVVDVAARLTTQRASVARIQALLAKATTIGQIVSIESELTQREADLESLEAQQAKLGDLTTLSTITATLLGPQAQLVVAKPAHRSGFVAGLDRGWHVFLASMAWLLTVLGAILPFAVGIAVVAWLVRLLVRRLQTRRMPPAADAPAPPASAP